MATRKNPPHYPRPEYRFSKARIGMTYEDSRPDYPPLLPRPPRGAPNIVLVLLDDVGYGWPSNYGGPVRMPTADRLSREGLTYCQFHTTALCAPTRASLLTGRNHHTVSTGIVQEMATGYPGYTGIMPRSTATIGEMLSPNGYATAWFGKNHNVPENQTSAIGPFDCWPVRRGFDYFYGFVGGETDQFYPALYRQTVPVEPSRTPEEGFQLTTEMADDCIQWMRTQKSLAPDRPVFVHFAPAAAHGPHQPPLAWRGRNQGRFDMGWDRMREEVFQRQLELGVIPEGTRLTSRPTELPAWDSFSREEQQLLSLQAEVFADYLEHCDHEVGRLLATLEELGEYENTLFIYILGDNGSSAEGGVLGTISEGTTMQGLAPSLEVSGRFKDAWGLPGTWPHFSAAWAWAGDTPFQWTKQVASHFGGTRNGMVVSWPNWIADRGARRFQFHHVIDIVPTLLEVLGLEEPVSVNGVHQLPLDGTSMAYTFDRANANAPSRHTVQYFEMLGNRALYKDGWMASCRHGRLPWQTAGSADFADDRWELYRVEHDFSQSEDLADTHPEKLRELRDQFLIEAARYNVFPLDDRFSERTDPAQRPNPFSGRKELTFYPGMDRLPEGSGPRLSNVDHVITFYVNLPAGVNGVLMCVGGDMGGWSLFCENGTLRYHYNWFGIDRYDVRSESRLPPGPAEIRMEFECDDPKERGGPADVRLFCNDRLVGAGRLPKQMLGRFGEPIDIGRDSLSPVYDGYRQRLPFLFTGTLERVEVSLGEGVELTEAEVMEEELHTD